MPTSKREFLLESSFYDKSVTVWYTQYMQELNHARSQNVLFFPPIPFLNISVLMIIIHRVHAVERFTSVDIVMTMLRIIRLTERM